MDRLGWRSVREATRGGLTDSKNAVVGLTIITTGSAASSAANRLRTPADVSDCAHSASAVTVSGYSTDDVNDVTSSWTVDMATTYHPRPVLQHELTYSDMEAPKGLHNSRGENNCFLNSAVQVTNFHSPFYSRHDHCLEKCVYYRTCSS